jgi:endonuclease/exonuclease/phosphatase family metal-dependent hydrolase
MNHYFQIRPGSILARVGVLLLLGFQAHLSAAETFRVASYNLQNYFLSPGNRPVKSPESVAKIHENILALKPDILAVQEMSREGLPHLQAALKAAGLDLPHADLITGGDTNIHVAVLSRFPIVARRSHTNDSYLLQGRRFRVGRGFNEVDIQVNDRYRVTVMNAHLKSKRPVPQGDQAEMRLQEATILREKIDARFRADPNVNLVLLGDLNDTKDSPTIRMLRGRGRTALTDTRPAEQNGDNLPAERSSYDPRNITWTYHYGVEDTYSRVDYILISAGLVKEWVKEDTYVLAVPNWGLASDHRPVVATFRAVD